MSTHLEGHTVQRYDGELSSLHMLVVEMGGLVLGQVEAALQALREKDISEARQVIERDHDVNAREVKADEEIVSVIARRAPVARDLRTIMSMSKAIADLERIGDEAAKIASIILNIYDNDRSDPSAFLMRDIYTMGNLAVGMLREALEVFDNLDADHAEAVATGNTEMDAEFQSSIRRLATFIMEDSRNLGHAINIVLIIKALERVGDHSRNIAEYVVYLIKGKDVRHRYKEIHESLDNNNSGSSD